MPQHTAIDVGDAGRDTEAQRERDEHGGAEQRGAHRDAQAARRRGRASSDPGLTARELRSDQRRHTVAIAPVTPIATSSAVNPPPAASTARSATLVDASDAR